jgi:predicted transcriptional regulator
MKTATFPSLRVAPEFRQAAEQVLQEGESLSSFVEESIRDNITRRQLQSEFVARGLASGAQAREMGRYVSTDTVLERLEKMLASAKAGK